MEYLYGVTDKESSAQRMPLAIPHGVTTLWMIKAVSLSPINKPLLSPALKPPTWVL